MKKAVLLLLALALALSLFVKMSGTPREPGIAERAQDAVATQAAAPARPAEAAAPLAGAPAAANGEGESAPSETPPMVFFPKANVVASVTEPADAQGRTRVIETVETTMKEPYVRVERVLGTDPATGKATLVSEVAMVANQILLQRPEGMSEEKFQEVLVQAGAIRVKELGSAYLATFEARPQDPKALDGYIARVRELAAADITIDPNYIRKIF